MISYAYMTRLCLILACMLLKHRFCKNVNAKDLSISVAAGEIKLKNVEVKASAFDELQLPITIKNGTVSLLHTHNHTRTYARACM